MGAKTGRRDEMTCENESMAIRIVRLLSSLSCTKGEAPKFKHDVKCKAKWCRALRGTTF